MDWHDIVSRDPFLAGAIAARGREPWDETTAEQEADSIHLTGEARAKFLAGWQFELAEREKERQAECLREQDKMAEGYEKGDPAR